ncbi:MAG: hypothetical protein V4587_10930 [Acidobacteriota bacterium]
MLRHADLKPYYHPEQFFVNTQWSVFRLLLALFVAGGVLWLVMLKGYGLFSGTIPAEIPDEVSALLNK